jgi:hypothetical protein
MSSFFSVNYKNATGKKRVQFHLKKQIKIRISTCCFIFKNQKKSQFKVMWIRIQVALPGIWIPQKIPIRIWTPSLKFAYFHRCVIRSRNSLSIEYKAHGKAHRVHFTDSNFLPSCQRSCPHFISLLFLVEMSDFLTS